MTKIFLSHSELDMTLFEQIEDMIDLPNVEWYLADREKSTKTMKEKISENILDSDFVVLLLTENAKRSEFVNQEIGFAVSAGKQIIIVRVDGAKREGFTQDHEYVPFDRSDTKKSFKELSETIAQTIKNNEKEYELSRGQEWRKLLDYHTAEVSSINDRSFPVRINNVKTPIIIMHIIPLNFLELQEEGKNFFLENDEITRNMQPLGSNRWDPKTDIDGIYSISPENSKGAISLVQFRWTGVIEAYDERFLNLPEYNGVNKYNLKLLSIIDLRKRFNESVRNYSKSLRMASVHQPYVVFITLSGVKDFCAVELGYDAKNHQITRDKLDLDPCIIKDENEIESVMRPAYDSLARACGLLNASILDKKMKIS